jgi:hypothetical protein
MTLHAVVAREQIVAEDAFGGQLCGRRSDPRFVFADRRIAVETRQAECEERRDGDGR